MADTLLRKNIMLKKVHVYLPGGGAVLNFSITTIDRVC